MNHFLSLADIQKLKDGILLELDNIHNKRILIGQGNPLYWQLLIHCFNVLIGKNTEFECKDIKGKIYECNNKLKQRKTYKHPTPDFAFEFVREKKLPEHLKEENYPVYKEFCLVISANGELLKRSELLAKTVAEAIDLEFYTYKEIPSQKLDKQIGKLKKVFDEKSDAFQNILKTVKERVNKSHTLKNKHNPSTKRLQNLSYYYPLDGDLDRAVVKTTEYFYLKWFEPKSEIYDVYEETNDQTYELEWKDDCWMITKNIYPPQTKINYK